MWSRTFQFEAAVEHHAEDSKEEEASISDGLKLPGFVAIRMGQLHSINPIISGSIVSASAGLHRHGMITEVEALIKPSPADKDGYVPSNAVVWPADSTDLPKE